MRPGIIRVRSKELRFDLRKWSGDRLLLTRVLKLEPPTLAEAWDADLPSVGGEEYEFFFWAALKLKGEIVQVPELESKPGAVYS